jgi:cold shock CspA family protein
MNSTVNRFNGTLKKWNDERGFGFLLAEHGDQELFVHVSAFPRGGRPPLVGEVLSFEVDLDRDGRKRAVKVRRPGDRSESSSAHRRTEHGRSQTEHRASRRRREPTGSSFGSILVGLLLVAGLGWYGYGRYSERVDASSRVTTPQGTVSPDAWTMPPPAPSRYSCDGRQHCSQMSSCAEAKYFIRNCPDTKMDGDGDGVPCETQWCGG